MRQMPRAVLLLGLSFLLPVAFTSELSLNSEQSLQRFAASGVPPCLGPSRSWADCYDDEGPRTPINDLTVSYQRIVGEPLRIAATNPHIYYHGRWDESPMSWWGGSGFKLVVSGLTQLTLHLGPSSSLGSSVGLIINDGPVHNIMLFPGYNTIVFGENTDSTKRTLVQIDAQEHWRNRLHLVEMELNQGAKLHPYTPQPLRFQFIGDSLTTGVRLQKGIHQSWGYQLGQRFKAETSIQAQPGICLTDQYCFGNQRGMEYQFFQTEDPTVYSSDRKAPTPWNFSNDLEPTHIFIHIGANDASNSISSLDFAITYMDFLDRLRALYPTQPFFVVGGWAWYYGRDNILRFYEQLYRKMVDQKRKHDTNIHFVNITGWLTWDDIFHDDHHPTELGHAKMARMMSEWIINWGGIEASTDWTSLNPPPPPIEEEKPQWGVAHGILILLFIILAL